LDKVCFPPDDPGNAPPWQGSEIPESLISHCDIPQEDNTLTIAEFKERYYDKMKPVLIKNVTSEWVASKKWLNYTTLEDEYGDETYTVGVVPPSMARQETLRSYFQYLKSKNATQDRMPQYLWHNALSFDNTAGENLNGTRVMIEDTETPKWIANIEQASLLSATTTVGPACSGSHYHQHNNAFCVLVVGMKHWILGSPDGIDWQHMEKEHGFDHNGLHPRDFITKMALHENRTTAWWKREPAGPFRKSLLGCTQHAGDFIFIPNGYGHAVINLWPSAAVNHEFTHGAQARYDSKYTNSWELSWNYLGLSRYDSKYTNS